MRSLRIQVPVGLALAAALFGGGSVVPMVAAANQPAAGTTAVAAAQPPAAQAPLAAPVAAAPAAAAPIPAAGGVPAKAPTRTPKVAVIGTGGTIAGVSDTRVSFQTYRAGQLPIADLVKFLQPEIGKVADVSTVQFGNKGSSGYTIGDYYDLSRLVDKQLETVDAIVVTTGTDTMEEFAYWLDLTVRSQKPVVLTGSMRPWTVIGTDAPANLYNAISLAASGRTTCYGSVIMLNDEIFPARDVTKTNALRMDTFQTREYGVLGVVDETRIRLLRAPARASLCDKPKEWATPFDLSKVSKDALPRVEVAYSYQDAGGEAITAYADAGVKGIVTAGTGAGGISPKQSAARTDAAAKGVVFVSTTRTGSGSVYGGSGNVIAGEDLLPQKARLLLLTSLAVSKDVNQIRGWFTKYGVQEVQPTR
ncbi:asparaginase [Actinopolymorpha alba]|uniref:asparaginase n=1 Tax=Actinopolymorpha alba TaxID=533267 RepID=UPI000360ECBE|nr:asparaginase [Actinopolymorpha alba]